MITGDAKADELIRYVVEHIDFSDSGVHFFPELKCLLPMKFLKSEKRIRDLAVYEDDIWVVTYPKCGSTWTQEMVWLIVNNLDYNGAEVGINSRFPFLEFSAIFAGNDQVWETGNTVDTVERMQQPRFIKTHLPREMLPLQMTEKKPKIVYVMRDPKDTAVSFYYHYRLFLGYDGTMEKFFEAFKEGCVQYGSYLHHNAQYWKLRHEPNVLVLTYEEMKKDLLSVIKRTAAFFGKSLTEEQVVALAEHLSFAKMKENNAVNLRDTTNALRSAQKKPGSIDPDIEFIRKGEVGDYSNKMSAKMVKKYDEWIVETKQLFGLENDKDFPY